MNAKLFRENAEIRDNDISWSHVGPGHSRAYFSLIPIAGYAAKGRLPTHTHPYYAPPFGIYSMAGQKVHDLSGKTYKTIPAAKRAARSWIINWLSSLPSVVTWEAENTEVHFTGRVGGVQVANYYFCPEATGHWHKDFRVWFGGTYYVTNFENPEQARSAVAATYERWLAHARSSLLVAP